MLKLEHISKSFDGVNVLNDLSLEVEDGEIVSILGPSGCGKTTLLNLILGITKADQGQIIYQGKDITEIPMEKREFNIVFQDYALFPNLNVYQNIVYGLRNKPNISKTEEVVRCRSVRTQTNFKERNRPAVRRTETASGTGENHGHEAEDPLA